MSFEIANDIAKNEPEPIEQTGEPTLFKRRTPEMSEIPEDASPEQIYDYIRMLDAEGYPNAFIQQGNHILSFTDAEFTKDGELTATVRFKKKDKE